jgi:predicted signal transduction protein with EAL and GGDEF domain
VETLEELRFLQAHQCEEAQGYYFSRPVPAEQFAKLPQNGIQAPAISVQQSAMLSQQGAPEVFCRAF